MTAKIIIQNLAHGIREIQLDKKDQINIGRDCSCGVYIQHPSISRFHCSIVYKNGFYRLKDLGSKNGTFVNDQHIFQLNLKNGDMIRLGESTMILFEQEEEVSPVEVIDKEYFSSGMSFIAADALGETQMINLGIGERSIVSYEKAHKGLKALFRVTNALHICEFGEAVYKEILHSLEGVVSAERLFLLGYDPDDREIEIRQYIGPKHRGKVQLSKTILDETLLRKKVVLSHDCLVDERFSAAGSIIGSSIKSVISAPLQWQDEHYGILYLDNRVEAGAFNEEDAKLVAAIARQASQTLRRQKLTRDLEELFTSTIRTLVAAIEVKDLYTCGHSERVTQLSLAIADVVIADADQRKNVELASLLHDVGKIGIPVDVLHKNGKLNDSELAMIKNHPAMGYKIVGHIQNASHIALAVKHHHERFDGKGYPDGLAGDQIPLISRIIAIADTFDAMTSTRPYRLALTVEKALEEIKRNAGSQFDPEFTNIFVAILTNKDPKDLDNSRATTTEFLQEYSQDQF